MSFMYAYLCHHGIKGQKWGVRRFQNKDGSLTSSGKKRYLSEEQKAKIKKAAKVAAGVAGAAAIGYGAYKLGKGAQSAKYMRQLENDRLKKFIEQDAALEFAKADSARIRNLALTKNLDADTSRILWHANDKIWQDYIQSAKEFQHIVDTRQAYLVAESTSDRLARQFVESIIRR